MNNFDRRWSQVEEISATARREFQKWLDGTMWPLAAVLLCVWTLGLVASVTLDGGIHVAFAGAMVLMLAVWLRRPHRRLPMMIKNRSG